MSKWLELTEQEAKIVLASVLSHRLHLVRQGPGGDVTLAFNPDTMRFDSAIRNRVPLNKED